MVQTSYAVGLYHILGRSVIMVLVERMTGASGTCEGESCRPAYLLILDGLGLVVLTARQRKDTNQ